MSGVRGLLDDAQNTADRAYAAAVELADTLTDAAAVALDTEPTMTQGVVDELAGLAKELRDLADHLNNRIEQHRNALQRG
jgi:hypothetical protein